MSENENKTLREVEDRLSSLPDAILIDILSRLEIHCAASTSVLSSRWRHLWTGVTCFRFFEEEDCSETPSSVTVLNILERLTSPKLNVFEVSAIITESLLCQPILESCLRNLCHRYVEQISIKGYRAFTAYDEFVVIHVPFCLFEIHSLVTLKLDGYIEFPDNNAAAMHLPNLKKIEMDFLDNIPSWLGTLFMSSPLLEYLDLNFIPCYNFDVQDSDLQIFAPNLKYLCIKVKSYVQTPRVKIFIDAPTLTYLEIKDCTSCYYFIKKPTQLIKAYIGLAEVEENDWEYWGDAEEDYMHKMSKFIAGLSSAHELVLEAWFGYKTEESRNNIFTYLYFLQTTFPNLSSLRTTLAYLELNSWKDLLLALHCFPNLNNLIVKMENLNPRVECNKWCAPDSIPDCFVSSLKKIEITLELETIADELQLFAYILSNAIVLEKLCISIEVMCSYDETEAELLKYDNLCKSLLKLPRGSSTCEIVISHDRMRASISNEFKNTITW